MCTTYCYQSKCTVLFTLTYAQGQWRHLFPQHGLLVRYLQHNPVRNKNKVSCPQRMHQYSWLSSTDC